MDEFVMTIKKHKETIVIALAILMFILFGFCPAIDIIGKAKIGGLKLLFEGSGLGFARFLSIFVLLAPMFVALGRSVDLKLTGKLAENFSTLCFVAGIVLCLLFTTFCGLLFGICCWLCCLLAIYFLLSLLFTTFCGLGLLFSIC